MFLTLLLMFFNQWCDFDYWRHCYRYIGTLQILAWLLEFGELIYKGTEPRVFLRGLDDVIMYLRLKVTKRKNGILGFV